MAKYATENVYAEVEEEGGKVNRLVAVKGQPVPRAFEHLVDDSKTTDKPPAPLGLDRSTAARRLNTPTVAQAEERRAKRKDSDEQTSEGGGRRARRASSD
jgi:hypothetical protein